MKKRKFKDPDRPIETHPGYLGLYHDGSYDFEPVLQPFLSFPWRAYRDLETNPEYFSERAIKFSIGARALSLTYDRDIIDLLVLEKVAHHYRDVRRGRRWLRARFGWNDNDFGKWEIQSELNSRKRNPLFGMFDWRFHFFEATLCVNEPAFDLNGR
jgi:hypothetical protein